VKTSIGSIRRQELEKAAYDTISQRGFKGMTLEEVAKCAGVSKGVIHHYFPSKEELVNGMVRYANRLYAEVARDRLKAARSASERIWAIVESNLAEAYYESKLVNGYPSELVAGIHFEKLLRTHNAIDNRGRANLMFALRSLEFADARVVSHTIWNLVEGAWILPASESHLTKSVILKVIADYLGRIPGFDASVLKFQETPQNRAMPGQGKVAIRTIRRMELEKAALDTLYESGFRELTVQRIADKAQLSKGVVHHYFLNKDDLVAGALRHEFREFGLAVTRLLEKTSSPSERLWLVITAQLGDQYLQFSYLRWYMNSIEAGFRSESITQVYDIAEQRGRSNIAFALKQLMPAEDARKTTLALWSMIEGACYVMFSDRTITRKDVLLGIARYLTSSIPAFDSSVIEISGKRIPAKFGLSAQPRMTRTIEPEEICKATIEVWDHVGYRKFNFDLLAEHMAVPIKAIRQHYRSIGDLTAATLRYVVAQTAKISEHRSNQAKSASEALWSLTYNDLEPSTITRQRCEAYVMVLDAGMQEPRILQIYEAEGNIRQSAIASVLTRMTDAASAERTVSNLWTMIEGAWRLLPVDPGTTQSAIIEALSFYLVKSVPGFDPSVLKLSTQWNEEAGTQPDQ
jgi:TetR/AcrR family transcriptional regulator, transcriptional repressor of bet genes